MIGLDIGARTAHVCNRRTGEEHALPRAHLQAYLAAQPPTIVVLELTGPYGLPIAEAAHTMGHTVLLAHDTDSAALRQLLRKRRKTDRLDARLLADLAELAQREPLLSQNHLTPYAALRDLIHVRRLAHAWRKLTHFRAAVRNRNRSPNSEKFTDLEAFLSAQIEHYKQRTIEATPAPIRDLLTSIPGVTPALAALLYASLGDVKRFATVDRAVSYAGVAPRHAPTSGESRGKPSRARYCVLLNQQLHCLALRVAQNPEAFDRIGATYVRVRKRADGRRALHAVKRHLIRIAYGVLKSGEPYRPSPAAAPEQASA